MTASGYTKNNLPRVTWEAFVKITPTRAARLDGPFDVWTIEGLTHCEDGWIALDSDGYPFAIDAAEFERKWRPSSDVFVVDVLNCYDPDHSGECQVCSPIHPKQAQSSSTSCRAGAST